MVVIRVLIAIGRMYVKWLRRYWKAFRQKLTACRSAVKTPKHCFWWSIKNLLSYQVWHMAYCV